MSKSLKQELGEEQKWTGMKRRLVMKWREEEQKGRGRRIIENVVLTFCLIVLLLLITLFLTSFVYNII
jgi:hypothetical protein